MAAHITWTAAESRINDAVYRYICVRTVAMVGFFLELAELNKRSALRVVTKQFTMFFSNFELEFVSV